MFKCNVVQMKMFVDHLIVDWSFAGSLFWPLLFWLSLPPRYQQEYKSVVVVQLMRDQCLTAMIWLCITYVKLLLYSLVWRQVLIVGRTDRFKDIFEEVYESGWKVKFEAAKIWWVFLCFRVNEISPWVAPSFFNCKLHAHLCASVVF